MMRSTLLGLLATFVALGGCSSSGENKKIDAAVVHDAPRPIDAAPADVAPPDAITLVERVDCAGATSPSITATGIGAGGAYAPQQLTVPINTVVVFTMPASHNVVPNATASDDGLHVSFGQTKCLKFTALGTFGFHCGPHLFTGSVTVQ